MNNDNDADRARKTRNIVIALGLVAFVVLIFVVTYVRLQGNVGARPL
jgi:ABC-type transporter Mla subunit MlaD